jgi:DNA modification methylase
MIDPDDAAGTIYCRDCKYVLGEIPDESIDLIYLDPPFFSRKEYENFWIKDKVTTLKFTDKDWEALRHTIDPAILKEYEEIENRWRSGHMGIYVFIAYMRERVEQCWRVLKPTGSIYLHCDWHAGHYLKVMMDEVFGYNNFRNEIIWRSTNAAKSKAKFGTIHQTILFYVKSKAAPFYPQRMPYVKRYIDSHFTEEDALGRYRADNLTGAGIRSGDSGMSWRGFDPTSIGRHWQPPSSVYAKYTELTGDNLARYDLLTRLDKLDEAGLIYWTKNKTPCNKSYLNDAPGVAYQDIWAYQPGTNGCLFNNNKLGIDQDVAWLPSGHPERLGHPTQKPEGLLSRIIRSSSKEDDIVLDPFCGCGTTLVVAEKLNRRWIGIDISRTACDVVRNRLKRPISIIGGETEEELRVMPPHEFARLLIVEKLNGTINPRKSGDMGIDGWTELMSVAVQVKRWGHKVGRPEIDKFRTAVQRGGKSKGMIISFEFSRDCWNEIARIKKDDGIDIKLKTVKEIIELE